MRFMWFIMGFILSASLICWGAEKKGEKQEKKEATEAPPVAKKVITGYRAGQWGMEQDKVMAKEASRHKDIQEQPDYVLQLGLPDDVKALIPESGKLPRRAPFRNFEAMLDLDAAECRVVYYFFEDKLYMIWCREPLLRRIVRFKDWKQEMYEKFGAPTSENSDGSMVWDQEITYCKATPKFTGSAAPTDSTLLEDYIVFMYDKRAKKKIIEWMKQNLKP